jgi:hypothetical protein
MSAPLLFEPQDRVTIKLIASTWENVREEVA